MTELQVGKFRLTGWRATLALYGIIVALMLGGSLLFKL
jgi:hypothetical protein